MLEYAKYLPFGISIAASFIGVLHVPRDILPMDDGIVYSQEEIIKDAYERGGKIVDKELRAMVEDIFHLQNEFNSNF